MQSRRSFLLLASLFAVLPAKAKGQAMLIHDVSNQSLTSALGTQWRAVSDQVMGGISDARVELAKVDGLSCLRLSGDVRLENNGGFVQASLDLEPGAGLLDATAFRGIRLTARGNGEKYSLHLRTADTKRPWQSYRTEFVAGSAWQTIDLPFASFKPYRLDAPLDLERLRRLGLVAIGRAFFADLAVAKISLYS